MSIIRDFVTKLPAACGVPAGLAEIYGELNGRLFDFELANPDGPLNRKNFQDAWKRIGLGVDPWVHFCDYRAGSFAAQLLVFISKTIDARGLHWEGKNEEQARLEYHSTLPWNAGVSSLMTVEQASTLGNWA